MQHNPENPSRTLIIIGGGEDKKGEKKILREVARRVGEGRLVVTTVASHEPEGYFSGYEQAFGGLDFKNLVELEIRSRAESSEPEKLAILDGATGVFFSGGDQLKITSQIGDTPVFNRLCEIYQSGGLLAGTSAGASVMCETMLVKGSGRETHRIGDLHMAPGLGFIRDVIIDQHFAERGRIGRLLGAIAHNPAKLGIGIDEDTAIVVENESRFEVIGTGGVYVADAGDISYSNIAEGYRNETLSIHDVHLHILSAGDSFDLQTRRPTPASA
ncbi:MAG TPA: cyanophycinase [Abditibacterium sp.]|jgi:cyanophycinase